MKKHVRHRGNPVGWLCVVVACAGAAYVGCAAPSVPNEQASEVGSGSPGQAARNDTAAKPPAKGGAGGTSQTGNAPPASPSPETPAPIVDCVAAPTCDGALPRATSPRGFRHASSSVLAALGSNAIGRETMFAAGAPQTLVARFAYGLDIALEDEDVDVKVQRGCAGSWETLGTTRTTSGGRAPVDGAPDDGGRVFFEVGEDMRLDVGRHRVLMTSLGDGTRVDFVVEVLPRGQSLVVSDVDGTLTVAEDAEVGAVVRGVLPDARPDAANVLTTLASKGYRIAYLTGRPEWLTPRTHAFLEQNGFPRGIVRTSSENLTGLTGPAVVAYKSENLALLSAVAKPQWLFGNTPTDAETYARSGLAAERRVFIDFADTAYGGRLAKSWSELQGDAAALPNVCKPK